MTNEEIYNQIFNNLDKEYELVIMDYRDEVSANVVEKCLDKKDIYPYYEEADEWTNEAAYQSAKYYLDDEIKRLDLDSEDEDGFYNSQEYDELIETILERDCSSATRDIFVSTDIQGRVTLNSNYEAINDSTDDFEYDGGYLRTMIDLLNLNPQLVKREGKKQGYNFLGKWPNIEKRNGHEIIRYEDVFRFIRDCWYYSQLTLVGRLGMDTLFDSLCKGNLDDLTIPKGTTFIAFSSWEGFGGENEFETINDLNIGEANKRGQTKYDCFDIYVDEGTKKFGYTTTDTYGGPVDTDYLF